MREGVLKASLIASVFVLVGCANTPAGKGEKKNQDDVPTVEATVITPSYIEKRLRLVGTVRGENEVLVFPDMGGRLLKLNVRDGQYVRKGQIVALIDRSAPGVDIKPMTVISPASGYVQVLVRDIGTAVSKDKPIMKIVDKRRLKVIVGVPEPYAGGIGKGTPLYVEGIRTSVSSVSPALDPKTRTLTVEATLRSGRFIPGQSVNVDVVVEKRDSTMVVPVGALVGGVKKGVFVVEGNRVKYVPVHLGITTSKRVEVISDLSFGDTVVVFGAASLKDGQRVRVMIISGKEGK